MEIQNVEQLAIAINKVREAQRIFATYTQEQVDKNVKDFKTRFIGKEL